MSHTTEVLAILWFLPILAKIWLPWQRLLDPRNQKCLLWIGQPLEPYHRTKNSVNNCYTSEVLSMWRFTTSLALRKWEIFRYLCNKYGKLFKNNNLTPEKTYLARKHLFRANDDVPMTYSTTSACEQYLHKNINRKKTSRSAIADGPRDALSQLKSCQLLHKCRKNHIWLEGLPFHVV